MRTALIALKLTQSLPQIAADYIGADKGALILARKGIRMKLAAGDFDSVEQSDMELIRQYADQVTELNPVKDDSDSEFVLRHVLQMGYDRIYMTGSLGGRADHMIVNLRLAYANPGVVLLDEANRIEAFGQGVHRIAKNGYRYISFFTEEEAVITLENMKYPLAQRRITKDDLYTLSNEILSDTGILTVHEGRVLVIQATDQQT